MVQRKIKNAFLLSVFLSSLMKADDYHGQSPYRLIFVEHPASANDFDVNVDVTQPSQAEQLRNKFSSDVLGAIAKGMIPLSGLLGTSLASPQADFLSSITSMSSTFSAALDKVIADSRMSDPFEATVYLLPYQTETRNLFYSSQKISMSPDQVTNVLITSKSSEKFEKTVTEQIKALQTLRFNTTEPVFLLGLQSSVFINSPSCGETPSCLKISVLLALKPTGNTPIPFDKANDQVTFQRIVIPGSAASMATANMLISIPLGRAQNNRIKAPTLAVEFGEFEAYSQGKFKIKEARRQNMAPGMEGHAKNLIPVTFSFSSLLFDLEDQHIHGLNILTSAGFLSKRGRLPLGGFKVASVNQQFEQEINNTIDAEMKSLEQSAQQNVEEKLKYTPLLKDALASIFGRMGQ